jgi:hypothetical protein
MESSDSAVRGLRYFLVWRRFYELNYARSLKKLIIARLGHKFPAFCETWNLIAVLKPLWTYYCYFLLHDAILYQFLLHTFSKSLSSRIYAHLLRSLASSPHFLGLSSKMYTLPFTILGTYPVHPILLNVSTVIVWWVLIKKLLVMQFSAASLPFRSRR